jgi:hypothetical protein
MNLKKKERNFSKDKTRERFKACFEGLCVFSLGSGERSQKRFFEAYVVRPPRGKKRLCLDFEKKQKKDRRNDKIVLISHDCF